MAEVEETNAHLYKDLPPNCCFLNEPQIGDTVVLADDWQKRPDPFSFQHWCRKVTTGVVYEVIDISMHSKRTGRFAIRVKGGGGFWMCPICFDHV